MNELLAKLGYKPVKGKENLYISPFNESESTPSFYTKDKAWKCFSSDFGGNNIEFLKKKFNLTTAQAFDRLRELNGDDYVAPKREAHKARTVPLNKPKSHSVLRVGEIKRTALTNYLLSRGIHQSYHFLLKQVDYLHHKTNRAFYGVGLKNDNDGYTIRSQYAKLNIGKSGITTLNDGMDTVRVFEGMFDFVSWCVLTKLADQNSTIKILNSTVNAKKLDISSFNNQILYLDNGYAGDIATLELMERYPNAIDRRSFKYKNDHGQTIDMSLYGDVNDMLLGKRITKEEYRVTKQDDCYNIHYGAQYLDLVAVFLTLDEVKKFTASKKAKPKK